MFLLFLEGVKFHLRTVGMSWLASNTFILWEHTACEVNPLAWVQVEQGLTVLLSFWLPSYKP